MKLLLELQSMKSAFAGDDRQLTEVTSAAQYLHSRRTWTGVDSPLTGAAEQPVTKAVPGRSGRAAHYSDEPVTASSTQE